MKEAGTADAVGLTTLFQAASISKPMAATAMLRLVEHGTLDLDAKTIEGLVGTYQRGPDPNVPAGSY